MMERPLKVRQWLSANMLVGLGLKLDTYFRWGLSASIRALENILTWQLFIAKEWHEHEQNWFTVSHFITAQC